MTMDHHAWDDRYEASELVWSADPNVFVAEVAAGLPAGRSLDLACGEGRNAIWLAREGWASTGVDFSEVAIGKARRLAERAGVAVDFHCHDVVNWEPPVSSFDFVVLCYLHLPAEAMAVVVDHAHSALAPGGSLLVVGHALSNLAGGIGGPQDPAVLYEPADVVSWLGDLEVLRAEHVTREVGTAKAPTRAIDTLAFARRAR